MQNTNHPFQKGRVLLIDKPLNWTSFDVVNKIRYTLKKQIGGKIKVGHAGTLDPLATGLLILCTGKFTKRINDYQGQNKTYAGTIYLGATTPTFDLESTPENFKDTAQITEDLLKQTVLEFTGMIQQVPPIHSAIKKDGKKAYELARKGEEVKLTSRTVEIESFEITRVALPEIDFKIVCSKGTYIRSIANDLGEALGCGGYLSRLRRTAIGDFSVAEAKDIEGTIAEILAVFKKDTPPQS